VSDAFQTAHTSTLSGSMSWLGQGGEENDNNKSLDDVSTVGKKPTRALIVEDEMFIALHLETLLQDLGLEVSEIVATGREALDTAIANEPDVVFMDINLRGNMDGVEAARLIRETLELPIIFVTAYGNEATLKRVRAVAPDAPVLQKPLSATALAAAISTAIRD
jgi:two-component system, response regulator PdtaR